MTAVLLSILGVIGKVLLILLLIILAVLALVLFYPVSYKADVRKSQEEVYLYASVSWLFRFVHAIITLRKKDGNTISDKAVRIAGIPILRIRPKRKNRKSPGVHSGNRKGTGRPHRKPTVQPGQKKPEAEQTGSLPVEVISAKHPGILMKLGAKISAFTGKIKVLYRRICKTKDIGSYWLEYLGSESFARAKDTLLQEGMAVLRHVCPRKISGSLCFGTDDPATTGMIFGLIAMLYPVIPEKLTIQPDFLESGLEADISARGRIFLIVPIVHAVRMLINKDVRRMIRRIMKKSKTGTENKKADAGHRGRGKAWQKTKKKMYFRTT